MGMKQRLMAQAAAAKAAEEAAAGGSTAGPAGAGTGAVTTKFSAVDDVLWKIQNDILTSDDLTSDMDLKYRPPPEDEPNPDEPVKASKFKWATSLDNQFKFDFKTATPKEDIAEIDWGKDIKGMERSEAGAEGVFFIETNSGALVLKGSRSMGAEVFSCLLGINLGIFCPRWRLIETGNFEGNAMFNRLTKMDTSGRLRTSIGSQTHTILKGYLPGTNFGSLTEARCIDIFGMPGKPSANGKTRLREIGRILALDVICNNGDRFPLIWDNRGNPGNVMMATGPGKAVSIDSQMQPIDAAAHPDQMQAYLDRVISVRDGLKASGSDKELPEFANVREKLAEYTGHHFGAAESIEMQMGYMEVTGNKESFGMTTETLGAWRTAMASYTPPLVGMDSADVGFAIKVWETM